MKYPPVVFPTCRCRGCLEESKWKSLERLLRPLKGFPLYQVGMFDTIARSWRGLSAHPTVKFRNLAKNSTTFLAFHTYVMKSRLGRISVCFCVIFAAYPVLYLACNPPLIWRLLKGTVSPDIGLNFSFWKIKLVLSAELPMVLTFFNFVVPEIFKNLYLNCFYENTY
jgi:hypothetical protein